MKVTKLVTLVVMGVLFAATTYGAIGDVWDFAADWSVVSNPNGVWSYRVASTNALLLADTDPWTGSGGWSASGAPGFGPPWVFIPPFATGFGNAAGEYVTPGGASYQWQSPVTGMIDISGVIGEILGWGATSYDVLLNGVSIGGGAGIIPHTPFSHQTAVVMGDIIDFRPLGGSVGTLVLTQIVPEPMTLGLLAVGALFIRKRRA